MRTFITGTIILLFSAFSLMAQYINSDSLVFIPGFEVPLSLNEFDSLRFTSPESDLIPGEMYYQQHIPSGRILGEFVLPSNGPIISRFGPRNGRMHTGTDIKMNRGDTIYTAFYGTVTRSRYHYGYGNMVVVEHGNSLETSYAHLSEFLVKDGETVAKGQPVGLAGNTGRATTSHLHFEIREDNKPFDPELVFDFEQGQVREETQFAYNLNELHRKLNPFSFSLNEPTPQHYKVKNGDSLWNISRRFRTSVNSLCMLNGLKENSVLQPGMVLKIYEENLNKF